MPGHDALRGRVIQYGREPQWSHSGVIAREAAIR
jgi:hypothetical protein